MVLLSALASLLVAGSSAAPLLPSGFVNLVYTASNAPWPSVRRSPSCSRHLLIIQVARSGRSHSIGTESISQAVLRPSHSTRTAESSFGLVQPNHSLSYSLCRAQWVNKTGPPHRPQQYNHVNMHGSEYSDSSREGATGGVAGTHFDSVSVRIRRSLAQYSKVDTHSVTLASHRERRLTPAMPCVMSASQLRPNVRIQKQRSSRCHVFRQPTRVAVLYSAIRSAMVSYEGMWTPEFAACAGQTRV